MSHPSLIFRVADLPQKRATQIDLTADTALREQLAQQLEVDQLRKLTFKGTLAALGKTDWALSGHIGATVVQPCVVTLEPVVTRIEESVHRQYLSDWQDPEEAEVEMPEDDTSEALGTEINVLATLTEALSLAIPAYPRAEGAALGALVHAEPGVEPLNEDTVRPFAGLADLKKKMEGGQ
jgi:uncharacterized metal-binding protein YceD (DUF177 family)